ncbi:hypothetical protein GQ457_13G013910 [Hibiscus cannabinus]
MASTSGNNLYDSQSITKLPYFNGDNYPYWKNRMRLFIKSNDYQVWDVVEDGPFIPSKREVAEQIRGGHTGNTKVKPEVSQSGVESTSDWTRV